MKILLLVLLITIMMYGLAYGRCLCIRECGELKCEDGYVESQPSACCSCPTCVPAKGKAICNCPLEPVCTEIYCTNGIVQHPPGTCHCGCPQCNPEIE